VKSEQHTEAELVAKIKLRDNETLKRIYSETYPMVEKYILKNNGRSADAEDVFQDAFYLMIKKVMDPEFILSSKISTFLFGISKNLWLKQLTKKSIDTQTLKSEQDFDLLPESDHLKLERVQLMQKSIEKLGEPCRTIIVQFYFLETSMKEIAKMLNYTNANNAKNQKYKCFMRLKKILLG
jgi:RNA polymerase sigma factor (sigma-70 family)